MTISGPLPCEVPAGIVSLLHRWRRCRGEILGALAPVGATEDGTRGIAMSAARELAALIAEGAAFGVTMRDPDAGWVDIAWTGGTSGSVACWREGEAVIAAAHAADAPCASRRPV